MAAANDFRDGIVKVALPLEIWEVIFSQLPIVDLFRCHALVCKQWKDVIYRDKFLYWKKTYYQIKSERVPEAQDGIKQLCRDTGATSVNNCLLGLISFCAKLNQPSLSVWLEKHVMYSTALKLLEERHPQALLDGKPSPWSVIAVLCIIADNVYEMYELLQFVLNSKSECMASEIIEGFYCIAAFLLHFTRVYGIPSRLHYQIYYALHLYENSWTTGPVSEAAKKSPTKGQQPISSYVKQVYSDKPLTHEQMRIINHTFGPNEIVKIVAFAGSGKTTTLKKLAESRPATQFLLVVYNKSTKEHASRTFPRNTKCYTAHGLAFQKIGFQYQHKFTFNLKAYDISHSRILPERRGSGNHQRRAGLVLKTLTKFLNSSDEHITIAHVPLSSSGATEGHPVDALTDEQRLALAEDADLVWEAMKSKTNHSIRMPHDGYLKLWQLTKPDLVRDHNINCILVDEGQDLNPAMLDVVRRQNCPRLIVGDPHQQIYQFRDAVNALNTLQSSRTFYLTQSFRFGPEIGFVANACLQAWKNITNNFLVGGKIRDSLETGEPESGAKKQQVAVIARTNFELFKEAVSVFLQSDGQPRGPNVPKLGFAGGFDGYDYGKLIDMWRLNQGDTVNITDNFVKRFRSYDAFKNYVISVDDQELLSKIRIVEWAGSRVVQYVQTLRKLCVGDERLADVVFSTVHKAKGLEWDTVRLLDDFGLENYGILRQPSITNLEADVNLLYVAATRAKKKLVLNTSLFHTLLKVHEKFERFRPGSVVASGVCKNCTNPLPGACNAPKTLALEVRPVLLSNGIYFPSGVLCSLCTAQDSFIDPFTANGVSDHAHAAFSSLTGPLPYEMEHVVRVREEREDLMFLMDEECASFFDSVRRAKKYWDFGEDDVVLLD